jgi:RND family efflux transporter MFP subunit
MYRTVLIALVPVLLATPPATPQSKTAGPPGEAILLRHCLAEYRDATQLGAPTAGVIQDCLVDLGDRVKAAQVLGRIQDLEQRAEMERAKLEAENLAPVKAAESRLNLAQSKSRRSRVIIQRQAQAISREEFEVLQKEEETARLTLEEAQVLHRLAELRYRQAEAAVRTREITSPHDGVVVEILRRKGEAVSILRQDPVFEVVNPELLRVTGRLDVVDAWRVHKGQAVRVTPEVAGPALPIQGESFPGRVIFVDSKIDPKTRTCRVVAEVKNRKDLLLAGLELQMEVYVGPTAPGGTAGR